MFRLIRNPNRSGVPIQQIVEAIAQVYHDGKGALQTVNSYLEKNGKESVSIEGARKVFSCWRIRINKALAAGDVNVVKLCKDADIIVDANDPIPLPRKVGRPKKV